MKTNTIFCAYLIVALAVVIPVRAEETAAFPGLKNAVILIIRHAEKTGIKGDNGLSPQGLERAQRYVGYFQKYMIDKTAAVPDCLIASETIDGKSDRPNLTIQPLSKALHLDIEQKFDDKQAPELAAELQAKAHGKVILICWHHKQIKHLLQAFDIKAKKLLGADEWPDGVFNWVVQLRFDSNGKLMESKVINENLMDTDAQFPPPAGN